MFVLLLFLLMFMSPLTSTGQTTRQLKVYQKTGMVDVVHMNIESSIKHSCVDLNGQEQQDYVTIVVNDAEGHDRQYLISQIDSLVLPTGQRVVFIGNMTGQPSYARMPVNWTEPDASAPRRTSLDGKFPGSGTGNVTFRWTDGDHIRLDVGAESRAEGLTNNGTCASFIFDNDDLDAGSYQVYYPDKNVMISTVQTQMGAANSEHIGPSGDCGTARATRNENDGSYNFTLAHKAAYLCFLPHIDYLPSARITKITLSCSAAIAGTYQLSESGLYNGSKTSNAITLNLIPQKDIDFFIGHDVLNEQDTCAAFMVIAPQTENRTFTATYYVTDTLSRITTYYKQTFSLCPVANTVYPVTCRIPETLFRTVDMGYDYLWSSVNVGSELPNDAGTFYTQEAMTGAMTADWQLPTLTAASELLNKCIWEWGEYNGTEGWFVIGTNNGNEDIPLPRIFLPLNGYQENGVTQQTTRGYYWLSASEEAPEGQGHMMQLGQTVDSRLMALMNSSSAINARPVKAVPEEYRIPVTGTDYLDMRYHGPGYSFKVYDSGGLNGNYSNNADGYLVITCAEGYKLNIRGKVDTENYSRPCDPFEIYENDIMMAQWAYMGNVINYTSKTNVVKLRLASDGGTNQDGVDLTVTIQRKLTRYNVAVADVLGGLMTANTYEANPEDTIFLTATPAEGYVLDHIQVTIDTQVLTIYDDDPKMFGTNMNGSRYYQMCDTVRVRDGNWYHDTSFFLMPYGNVTVTPVFVRTENASLHVNMAAKDTVVVERKYMQRLVDGGLLQFSLYDAGGKDGNYKNYSRGYLLVEAPVGYRLRANGSYQTESGYDYLYMYDGNNSSFYQWFDKAGSGSFDATTNNNDMFMYFYSDGGTVGWGYDATITMIPDNAVQYNIPAHGTKILTLWHMERIMEQGLSMQVYDHAGPDADYGPNVDGSLRFCLPEGWHARISGDVDTEQYDSPCDPFEVYDGPTTNAPRIAQVWRPNRTVDVTTTTNDFLLRFKSDSGSQRSGVNLTVEFIQDQE